MDGELSDIILNRIGIQANENVHNRTYFFKSPIFKATTKNVQNYFDGRLDVSEHT